MKCLWSGDVCGGGGGEGVELELKARINAENSRKALRIRTVRASRVYRLLESLGNLKIEILVFGLDFLLLCLQIEIIVFGSLPSSPILPLLLSDVYSLQLPFSTIVIRPCAVSEFRS